MKATKAKKNFSVFYAIIFLFLALYVFAFCFLFGWGFINSFKGQYDDGFGYYFDKIGFPKIWHFTNYVDVFFKLEIEINAVKYNILHMLSNTLLYTLGTAFVSTITPCIVAYLIATYDKFIFSKIVHTFVIVTMMLPIIGASPSVIQVLRFFKYYDSIVGMWLMNVNFLVGIHFLIFYDAFRGVSKTYKEAAEIDGASQFRTMVSVMLPLVKTVFITVFLLRFIAYWNDYQTPLLYMPNNPTIAYGIFIFSFQSDNVYSTVPMKLSAAFIIAIPIIVLFVIFRNKIMQNVTVGGVK